LPERELAPELEAELRALVRAACGGAALTAIEPLHGGGLGHRRFLRLRLAGATPASVIARVDRGEPAPGVLPEPPLEPLRSVLEAHGLPLPRRVGGDAARGIDLLEDLGDVALADVVADRPPAERRALYEEACDWIPRLQRVTEPSGGLPAFHRALDATLFGVKARRFAASGLRAWLGRDASGAERACVHAAFDAVAEQVAAAPQRLAHRDYQSRNLLLHRGRLAMIDVQGAFLAPPEYDAVCLLRDSYVVLSEAERASLAERVRVALPDAPDAPSFALRFDLLTVTRKGKDFALFHEVAARGDPSWLRHAPATAAYLRDALGRVARLDPRLAALADLLGVGACAR
jgi:aminoglycoside/choline kinase family phosphotransferase